MSTTPHSPPPAMSPLPLGPAKSGIPLPLIIIDVVALFVVAITIRASLTAPILTRATQPDSLAVATHNDKNLVLALIDFSTEYGSFPDRHTAKDVIQNTGSSLNLNGDTSNDYFRQLIAAGVVHSEYPFWTKTSYSPVPPDNNMVGDEALKAGEVGFGYFMNGDQALVMDDPNLPIALAPSPYATGGFDIRRTDDKWVLLHIDGSVRFGPIHPKRKSKVGNAKTPLDAGEESLWGADVNPVIKPPKMR